MRSDDELLRDAFLELRQEAVDLGGCDHSAGICQCSLNRLVDELGERIQDPSTMRAKVRQVMDQMDQEPR